ncbi:MAG: tyrosine-type recombinase/integrase [Alphaproteobacteria bacterium]|nr:tyrosine-type recombinase/integrase [Alphaproteobacteria bacterium]
MSRRSDLQSRIRDASDIYSTAGHAKRWWDKLDVAGWRKFGVQNFYEFRKGFGKPAITLHGLRHAYASLEIERGVTPKVLQQRMGHSSYLTTTDLYGHLWKDRTQDKNDAEALDSKVTEIGEMLDLDFEAF